MTARAYVILVTAVVLTTLYIGRLVRLRQLRSKYALLWLTIGVLLLPVAAVPSLLDWVADRAGVDYAPALFALLAIAFLFLVVVHYSWELSRLETKVRTLAEEVALLRADHAESAR